MTTGYKLKVYKKDRRCKNGLRLVNSYDYKSYDDTAMVHEVVHLKSTLYKASDGWELDVEPLTVEVKNLMTGEMVTIRYEDRGTACDPSMERYWSM